MTRRGIVRAVFRTLLLVSVAILWYVCFDPAYTPYAQRAVSLIFTIAMTLAIGIAIFGGA